MAVEAVPENLRTFPASTSQTITRRQLQPPTWRRSALLFRELARVAATSRVELSSAGLHRVWAELFGEPFSSFTALRSLERLTPEPSMVHIVARLMARVDSGTVPRRLLLPLLSWLSRRLRTMTVLDDVSRAGENGIVCTAWLDDAVRYGVTGLAVQLAVALWSPADTVGMVEGRVEAGGNAVSFEDVWRTWREGGTVRSIVPVVLRRGWNIFDDVELFFPYGALQLPRGENLVALRGKFEVSGTRHSFEVRGVVHISSKAEGLSVTAPHIVGEWERIPGWNHAMVLHAFPGENTEEHPGGSHNLVLSYRFEGLAGERVHIRLELRDERGETLPDAQQSELWLAGNRMLTLAITEPICEGTWNAPACRQIGVEGAYRQVHAVAFTSSGRRLASASAPLAIIDAVMLETERTQSKRAAAQPSFIQVDTPALIEAGREVGRVELRWFGASLRVDYSLHLQVFGQSGLQLSFRFMNHAGQPLHASTRAKRAGRHRGGPHKLVTQRELRIDRIIDDVSQRGDMLRGALEVPRVWFADAPEGDFTAELTVRSMVGSELAVVSAGSSFPVSPPPRWSFFRRLWAES